MNSDKYFLFIVVFSSFFYLCLYLFLYSDVKLLIVISPLLEIFMLTGGNYQKIFIQNILFPLWIYFSKFLHLKYIHESTYIQKLDYLMMAMNSVDIQILRMTHKKIRVIEKETKLFRSAQMIQNTSSSNSTIRV